MPDDNNIMAAFTTAWTPEQIKPVDLHLDRRDGLRIAWADGRASRYPLAYLRQHCPCAGCRGGHGTLLSAPVRPDPTSVVKPNEGGGLSLNILPQNIEKATQFTSASLVGNYALQITWGDGHSTGIYDFRYLRQIEPVAMSNPIPPAPPNNR